MLVRIDEGRTRKYSKNMLQVRLPLVWTKAQKVKSSGTVHFYSDTERPGVLVVSAVPLKGE